MGSTYVLLQQIEDGKRPRGGKAAGATLGAASPSAT
jgi:hypothetical protein